MPGVHFRDSEDLEHFDEIYAELAPQQKRAKISSEPTLPGFVNGGNQCFLISLVQMIASEPLSRSSCQELLGNIHPLKVVLNEYVEKKEQKSSKPISLQSLYQLLPDELQDGNQHDVHEAFLALFSDLNVFKDPTFEKTSFYGAQETECGASKPELTQISVALPVDEELPIQALVDRFLIEEFSEGDCQVVRGDERCSIKKKTKMFEYAPSNLFVQLNRFSFLDTGETVKNSTPVLSAQKIELLKGKNYQQQDQLKATYELQSFSLHIGGNTEDSEQTQCGHYVAYVKTVEDGVNKFWFCNDTCVEEATEEEFNFNAQSAYFLRYVKSS